jgi:phosphoglycolate phosphatase
MRYKAIFCDLDGTILDTLDDLTNAVNHALHGNNFPTRTKDEIRSFLGNGSSYLIKKALPENTNESTFDKVYKGYKEYYKNHASELTKPYPGIIDFLTHFKKIGLKLVIITNKPLEIAKLLVDNYFPNTFDLIYGQSNDYKVKPDPQMVQSALKKLNLNNEDVFYFGDSLVDMKTAKNSNLDYALVSYGFSDKKNLIKEDKNHVVNEVKELWPLIK